MGLGCRFWLSEGAERLVFECCEVVSMDQGRSGICVGPRLVSGSPLASLQAS